MGAHRFREHEGVRGKRDAYPFDPRMLKVDPQYNVRDLTTPDAKAKLAELKEQIRGAGVRTPLEVRMGADGEVIVVSGHRRLAAVLELIAEGIEIESVLVIPETTGTSEAERTLNLALHNSGEPLKPLEIAAIVKRLTDFGWQAETIRQRMGWKSKASVTQHLDMLGLPTEVQQAVKDGKVSASLARKTEAETPGLTMKLIEANEQQPGLKVKKLKPKQVAKSSPKKPTQAKAPQPPPPEPPAEPPAQPPAQPEPEGATVEFDTEVHDRGGEFSTDTFTAPAGESHAVQGFVPLAGDVPPIEQAPPSENLRSSEDFQGSAPPAARNGAQLFESLKPIRDALNAVEWDAWENGEQVGIHLRVEDAKRASAALNQAIGE